MYSGCVGFISAIYVVWDQSWCNPGQLECDLAQSTITSYLDKIERKYYLENDTHWLFNDSNA